MVSQIERASMISFSPDADHFFKTPAEIALCIFQYLDVKSVIQFSMTCHKYRQLEQDERLWKFFWFRDFSMNFHYKYPKPDTVHWKIHYAKFHNITNPFPGVAAEFKQERDQDWRILCFGTRLIRQYSFISLTESSAIRGFKLYGYRNGDIALSIQILPSLSEQFARFLQNLHFNVPDKIPDNTLYFLEPQAMAKIFRIISVFNHIPEDKTDILQQLIKKGNWLLVTPIVPEEEESMKGVKVKKRE